MRQEDIKRLSEPYTQSKGELDRRLYTALGADVPSVGELDREIFNDIDPNLLGISWWQSVHVKERILIGDYLHQCAGSIEVNLIEAKIHYLEWLGVREKLDAKYAEVVRRTPYGTLEAKHPPSVTPIDDMINRLEDMHICGFFQAIGSSLDCLGGVIIGVLGLDTNLRWNDIEAAERALGRLKPLGTPGSQMQVGFRDLFETAKKNSGPEDWLAWASQYRNMFIHRGRRLVHGRFVPRETRILNADEEVMLRTKTQRHLAKYPDKSDMEAFIKHDVILNEDADITFQGIFKSSRDFIETVCNQLVAIWRERRANPSLIEQPATQWNANFKPCNFSGYDKTAPQLDVGEIMANPALRKRMIASAVVDQYRVLWLNSPWNGRVGSSACQVLQARTVWRRGHRLAG